MKYFLGIFLFLTVSLPLFTQTGKDTGLKEKRLLAGSTIVVPQGKTWTIEQVYVNDGGTYNILAGSLKTSAVLKEGDKLTAPSWSAEAELLNGDPTGFFYIYKIRESENRDD